MIAKHAVKLKNELHADILIVNGENAAGDGRGITSRVMRFFKQHGVDVVTTGNHVFQKKDVYANLEEKNGLLRPENFPSSCPGSGVFITHTANGHKVGVVNIQGRTFMREYVSCPFRALESTLTYLRQQTSIIFVDFHAETTAEKIAFAWHFDGKISALVGTHTHVQTADERILPQGTGFISDVGMCGARNSIIGMKPGPILHNMITQMPSKFEVETALPYQLCGVKICIDVDTGKTETIQRICIIDEQIGIDVDNQALDEKKQARS